jgi:hypothetical protein
MERENKGGSGGKSVENRPLTIPQDRQERQRETGP